MLARIVRLEQEGRTDRSAETPELCVFHANRAPHYRRNDLPAHSVSRRNQKKISRIPDTSSHHHDIRIPEIHRRRNPQPQKCTDRIERRLGPALTAPGATHKILRVCSAFAHERAVRDVLFQMTSPAATAPPAVCYEHH